MSDILRWCGSWGTLAGGPGRLSFPKLGGSKNTPSPAYLPHMLIAKFCSIWDSGPPPLPSSSLSSSWMHRRITWWSQCIENNSRWTTFAYLTNALRDHQMGRIYWKKQSLSNISSSSKFIAGPPDVYKSLVKNICWAPSAHLTTASQDRRFGTKILRRSQL